MSTTPIQHTSVALLRLSAIQSLERRVVERGTTKTLGEIEKQIKDWELAKRVASRYMVASSTWYHLTDRAKFKLDPKFAPADNAIAIEDRSGRPGIYLGQSVEKWVNGFGYWRPFVVELKADSSVMDDPGVHGRYGGEMFVPATSFDKLTIQRVIPLDAYAREQYGEPGWIEGELEVEFDTGEPIPRRGQPGWQEAHKKYRGYRYPGPDVRQMPSADINRLKKQLRQVKR